MTGRYRRLNVFGGKQTRLFGETWPRDSKALGVSRVREAKEPGVDG